MCLYAGLAVEQSAAALTICATKLLETIPKIFILSILCGMLMQYAVSNFAKTNNIFVITFCIVVFIVCGFEHCIANMFYFAIANKLFSLQTLGYLIVNIFGNSVGGIIANRLEIL
jgi:formate/nitrite transporter FocA (FNT family)